MKKSFSNFLEELKKLDLPEGEYAIFGSGPLAVRGIREAEDLDVVVTKNLYEKLKEKYPEEKERINIGNIEVIPPNAPIIENAEELIKRGEIIKGFRFVSLKDIIEWKKKMGREKDLKDIELVKGYLKNIEQ